MNGMRSAAVGGCGTEQGGCRQSSPSGLRLFDRCGCVVEVEEALFAARAAAVRPFTQKCDGPMRTPAWQVLPTASGVMRGLIYSLLVVLLSALWVGPSWAKSYGHHDLRQLLVPAPTPGTGGSLNLAFFDRVLGDLSEHAGVYPPQFDSPTDRARASTDARKLIGMLNAAYGPAPPDGLLYRLALLGSFGHNLDVPDAALFAQTHFRRLLNTDGEHAMGNYHYGVFLAGIGRPRESLPYLNKARDKGVMPALYSIGMVHLTLGDKEAALSVLSEYVSRNQSDQRVKLMIDAIRAGNVKFHSEVKRQLK